MPTKAKTTVPEPSAASAAVAEVTGAPTAVEYEGFTYEIPTDIHESLEFLEAAEDNHTIGLCRALLGPDQWRAFKARHRTAAHLNAFIVEYGKQARVGNSSAS